MSATGPKRIVCLTEEPTEILCALGERERIVGISAFTVRPSDIKEEKPVVSAFLDGSLHKIEALKPDMVIGFSDIQAKLAAKLIQAHLPVLIFNQRSVEEIFDVIESLSNLVGAEHKGQKLIAEYRANLKRVSTLAKTLPRRPKVYFEEWDEPRISGIQWVSELIELAGGDDVFEHLSTKKGAVDRQPKDHEIIASQPDIIIGCWCGKPVDLDEIRGREGWSDIPAVKNNMIFEMDPAIILQPGPASLTDGINQVCDIIQGWAQYKGDSLDS